jgi:hypothetical protein
MIIKVTKLVFDKEDSVLVETILTEKDFFNLNKLLVYKVEIDKIIMENFNCN